MWTAQQQRRLTECLADPSLTVAYYCTDAHGYPANGGSRDWHAPATPGQVREVAGPLRPCGPGALHATLDPVLWRGARVWIVAMHDAVDVGESGDKIAALRREVIGEILPHEAWCPRLGARLGRTELYGADLRNANLRNAILSGAILYGASLRNADLRSADLSGADLRNADLYGAYLSGANLSGAKLSGANLRNADLRNADLRNADLRGADLSGADLRSADLRSADLRSANLSGADLRGAELPEGCHVD